MFVQRWCIRRAMPQTDFGEASGGHFTAYSARRSSSWLNMPHSDDDFLKAISRPRRRLRFARGVQRSVSDELRRRAIAASYIDQHNLDNPKDLTSATAAASDILEKVQ